jgi:integrase
LESKQSKQEQEIKEKIEFLNSTSTKIYPITEGVDDKTGGAYQRYFNRFLNHIKIHDRQVLLDFSPKVIKQMIIDYMLHLRERGIKRHSIETQVFAILHFFEVNNDEFNLRMKNLRMHLPPEESIDDDRPYTREEIAQVIQQGCDPRSKVAVLLLCSTGMRIGALHLLRIEDLTKIDGGGEFNLYKIQVYARTPDKYLAFSTPECRVAIDAYLDYRRRSGEQLNDKSPLIREQFNTDNPFTIDSPRFMSEGGIEYMVAHALERAGVRKPGEVHMSHGFRKFFENQCEDSPTMKSLHVDQLMGHDTGVKKHYLRTKESVLLDAYMQVADALTISSELRMKKQLQQQEERHSDEYEDIRRMYREITEEKIQLRKWLNEKVRPHGIKFVGASGRMVDIKTGKEY